MTTGMMNDTDVEAELLGEMEWEPPCEVNDRLQFWRVSIPWFSRPCAAPAAWLATPPCCQHAYFVCAGHRRFRNAHCCGHKWTTLQLTWTRI